jgi:lycopene beta-cyclase
MAESRPPIAILGAGLTGSLIALALAKRRPDVDFILIEQQPQFGGGAVGPFFLSSIPLASGWLIDPLVVHEWAGYHVAVPGLSRVLPGRTAFPVSEQIHAEIIERVPPERYRLGAQAAELRGGTIALADGEQIPVSMVLDARGHAPRSTAGSAWCQTSSRLVLLPREHELDRPILIDATFPETDWSFFQYWPVAPHMLLIQLVRHSQDPAIRQVDENILGPEQGSLVSESVTLRPLLPEAPAARARPDCGLLCVDGWRAAMWNPILPSPVSGAVRIAEAIAGARDVDFQTLAPRVAELERRAQDYGRRFAATIAALSGQSSNAKAAALMALCGQPEGTIARLEAGYCAGPDLAGLEAMEAAGLSS